MAWKPCAWCEEGVPTIAHLQLDDEFGNYWIGICAACFDDYVKGMLKNAKERLEAEARSMHTDTSKMQQLRSVLN